VKIGFKLFHCKLLFTAEKIVQDMCDGGDAWLSPAGGQWCEPPHLNSVPPISCLVPRTTTKL